MRLSLGLGLVGRGGSATPVIPDDGEFVLSDINSASSIDGMVITSTTYATFNPAKTGADVTLSNGNLTASISTNAWRSVLLNVGGTTGKRVFAVTLNSTANANSWMIGIGKSTTVLSTFLGGSTGGHSVSCRPQEGKQYLNGTAGSAIWPVNTGASDVTYGVAVDFDARTFSIIGADGVHDTSASTALSDTVALFGGIGLISIAGTTTITVNCGQSAAPFPIPDGYTWGIEA